MASQVEVVHECEVEGGDPRWPIRVTVERRTSYMKGRTVTYINLVVKVGDKHLFIPRRAAKSVALVLNALADMANKEYEADLHAVNIKR